MAPAQTMTRSSSSLIELSKLFGGSLTNIAPALVELKKVLPKIAAVGLPAAMPGLFQQGQCDVMYTNTQTVATLKGKGIDVEFVKPESGAIAFYTTMHIAKGTADAANAYKYLDLVAHGILFVTDKMAADGKPIKGYEPKAH